MNLNLRLSIIINAKSFTTYSAECFWRSLLLNHLNSASQLLLLEAFFSPFLLH